VEPAPAPETSNLEPVGELPPEKPAASSTRAKPAASRDTSRDTPKPVDTKPVDASPPPVEPPPAPPNSATQIRTPATVDTAAAEKQVRDTLNRAQQRLNNINYQRLNGDGQKAYNGVKDFMERAEAAIKASNFELAKGLASNAEKLANEIQSR
jgi:hypothetical protein